MMQVCEDLEEGYEFEIETIWVSDMGDQRDLLFMAKWNGNIFGHMEFTLRLIFFNVVGREAITRGTAFCLGGFCFNSGASPTGIWFSHCSSARAAEPQAAS